MKRETQQARTPRRAQLTLEELRQVQWILGGLLILLSGWTVFYLDVNAWILMGLTTIAVGAGLVRPDWPARVPRLVHSLAFPVIVVFFVSDFWLKGEVLPAIVRLDILLLLYRGICYRQRRDDLQVIVLGLFLIVVAGVLTVSPAFAVQIVAFTGCALALLLVITLADGVAMKPAAEAKKGLKGLITWRAPDRERPAWAESLVITRLLRRCWAVADGRVVALAAGLFAGVVMVSALLFLAIPRFQLDNSLFLERFIAKKARTGFNDSIKFGEVSEILQDTSVALSVDVSDPKVVPASPYWRMLVLDEYQDGGFRLSPALSRGAFGPERKEVMVLGEARPRSGAPVDWTFYLEPGVSRYLPLLGRFQELRFRETQTFRPSAELGVVALRAESATMTAYRVQGMEFSEVLPDEGFAERWRRRTESGAISGRAEGTLQRRLNLAASDLAVLAQVREEIARAFVGGSAAPTAAEFGRAASGWLRKQHGYSLTPTIPRGTGDALVRWLNSKEPGHCEMFAGSLVLLAREAGFAVRVVVGFKGGSWNGYSNNFTVRNSDAHAWAEMWDEVRGAWWRVDPLALGLTGATSGTAGGVSGEAAIAAQVDRSWTARLDSLRVFWYRRIVNFDASSQVETLQAVKTATETTELRLRETLEQALAALKAWLVGPWDFRRAAGVLGSLGLGAILFGAVMAVRRLGFNFRWGQATRKIDPVRREAGRWLERLPQAGDNVAAGAELAAVRAGLERLRFGAASTWQEPEAIFRRAREAVRVRARRPITRS